MSQYLLTGAKGFVGSALALNLARKGLAFVTLPYSAKNDPGRQYERAANLFVSRGGSPIGVVIHLAARVHVMQETHADPMAAFRLANVDSTLRLASQAAVAGVQRFVFMSSVKVNGESTPSGVPFSELDIPHPQDPYAVSKMEAEQGLRGIAAQTGMQVVIVRSPLIYGPGVKANFAALMRAVVRGVPLPLGAVRNLRGLVGLDNLVDFITLCAVHPAAANQTFLISDGSDLSTPDLVRAMAHAAGKPARLVSVPVALLECSAALLGRRAAVQRLCSNLQLDTSKAHTLLGWVAPVSLEEGLRRAFAGARP